MANRLSPDEARSLRRRRVAAQWGLGLFAAGALASMIALGYEGRFIWAAACLPAAALCLVLHGRGVRCPRCGRSVFGPRDVDENTQHAGDPGFGPALPERCGTCGVQLTPAESGRADAGIRH